MKLETRVVERNGQVLVRLEGPVDESNRLEDLLGSLTSRTVVIDASGVSRMNCFGIRDWVRWLRRLGERGNRLYLARCSVALTAPLNLMSNFCWNAVVFSVFAPYECDECGSTQSAELRIGGTGKLPEPPAVSCSRCGQNMSFDEDPGRYFDFAAGHVQRDVDVRLVTALLELPH